MDFEEIKQLANDVNNVAAGCFQAGKEHAEKSLLEQIERLQADNEKLQDAWDRLDMTNTRMVIKMQAKIEVQDSLIKAMKAENERLVVWLNRIAVTRPNDGVYSEKQYPYKMAEQALKGGEK